MFRKSKKKQELKNIIESQKTVMSTVVAVTDDLKRVITEQKDIIEFQKRRIDELEATKISTLIDKCRYCVESEGLIKALEHLVEQKEEIIISNNDSNNSSSSKSNSVVEEKLKVLVPVPKKK
jgi:hypothetical protein